MSQLSASSKSSHSNIFSLSSNKSDKGFDWNQVYEFKQKLCKLLNTDTQNLPDLFKAIQEKLSDRFVKQKIIEYDAMLGSLSNIKKNNRQMTKLITLLGIKVKSKQGQAESHNQNTHLQQMQNQENQETNPTQASEEYNYRHKSIDPAFNPILLSQDQSRNSRHQSNKNKQKQRTNYEAYQQRNKSYEDKIKNMLEQLGSIKKQLYSNQNIRIKNQSKQQRIEQKSIQKVKKPETHKNREQENQRGQVNKTPNNLNTNKMSTEKEQAYQSFKMNESLKKTHQKNNSLIQFAKNISRKLQSIKAQTGKFQLGINSNQNQSIKNKNNVDATQSGQKTIENVQANNYDKNQLRINIEHSQPCQSNNKQGIRYFESYDDKYLQFCDQNSKQQNKSLQQPDHEQIGINKDLTELRNNSHLNRKKSMLEDIKNVQSKVLISERNLPHSARQGTMIDMVNQANLAQQNKRSPNLVSQTSISNSLSESIAQSTGKQVAISYLTMQQPSSSRKWQQESSFGKIPSVENPSAQDLAQRSSQQSESSGQQRSCVNNIAPSVNSLSHYHNNSIMNARGSITPHEGPSNNSSVVRVDWKSPNFQDQHRYRQQGITPHNLSFVHPMTNHRLHSLSKQKQAHSAIVNNSSFTNHSNYQPNNVTQGPLIGENQPTKRLSFYQPPLNIKSTRQSLPISLPFSLPMSLPISNTIQLTPIRQPVDNRNEVVRDWPRHGQRGVLNHSHSAIYGQRGALNHSHSAFNINLNDLQNRFKCVQNKRPISQQKYNSDTFLNNTSYISHQNLPYTAHRNGSTGENFSLSNNYGPKPFFKNKNQQNKVLKNPFQQLKAQKQYQHRIIIRPSFHKQNLPATRQSFSGINMSFANSGKLQPFVTLGNLSKISRDSRDSKGSRKSKGLHILPQAV